MYGVSVGGFKLFGQNLTVDYVTVEDYLDVLGKSERDGFYHESWCERRAHMLALTLKALKKMFPQAYVSKLDDNTVIVDFRSQVLGGHDFKYAMIVDVIAQERAVTKRELEQRIHRISRRISKMKWTYKNLMFVFIANKFTSGAEESYMGKRVLLNSGARTEFFFLFELYGYLVGQLAKALTCAHNLVLSFFLKRIQKLREKLKALRENGLKPSTSILESLVNIVFLLTAHMQPEVRWALREKLLQVGQ